MYVCKTAYDFVHPCGRNWFVTISAPQPIWKTPAVPPPATMVISHRLGCSWSSTIVGIKIGPDAHIVRLVQQYVLGVRGSKRLASKRWCRWVVSGFVLDFPSKRVTSHAGFSPFHAGGSPTKVIKVSALSVSCSSKANATFSN